MSFVRVQILLEPRQHRALKRAAQRANKSMSALVREMADRYLAEQAAETRDEFLEVLDHLRSLRERQPVYRGSPVAEARAEREGPLADD